MTATTTTTIRRALAIQKLFLCAALLLVDNALAIDEQQQQQLLLRSLTTSSANTKASSEVNSAAESRSKVTNSRMNPTPAPTPFFLNPFFWPPTTVASTSTMPALTPAQLFPPYDFDAFLPTTTAPTASLVTTFCILADAPYNERMRLRLIEQVDSVYEDCEFVAHLGDIRSARQFDTCVKETYTNASRIMARSSKPVFMMIGDNEWNDCPNHEEALGFWHEEFDHFTDTHWPSHGFDVSTQRGRIENRYFVHKQTLFINLNIVGGRVHNATEWNDRLTGNYRWTRNLIQTHVVQREGAANAVVIMAHATNSRQHRRFFRSMRSYIRDSLKNTVPILYLNGDTHRWNHERNYFDQPSWLRITLEGEARQPILKVMVDGSSTAGGLIGSSTIDETFSYDRGL